MASRAGIIDGIVLMTGAMALLFSVGVMTYGILFIYTIEGFSNVIFSGLFLGTITVTGGVFAIIGRRSHLALAGAVIGIILFFVFSLPGLVMILLSMDGFES